MIQLRDTPLPPENVIPAMKKWADGLYTCRERKRRCGMGKDFRLGEMDIWNLPLSPSQQIWNVIFHNPVSHKIKRLEAHFEMCSNNERKVGTFRIMLFPVDTSRISNMCLRKEEEKEEKGIIVNMIIFATYSFSCPNFENSVYKSLD